jgi:hypothetical protein
MKSKHSQHLEVDVIFPLAEARVEVKMTNKNDLIEPRASTFHRIRGKTTVPPESIL